MTLFVTIILLRHREALLLAIAACLAGGTQVASAPPTTPLSWEKPRMLADFQPLMKHSPFALPTAEDSSPLADRYALTGIVTINGEEEIFVCNRTDQSREMLTRIPNKKNMSLVALVREGNAVPQKATIRVGSDTGTIGYLEAAQQQAQPAAEAPGRPPGVKLPPLPQPPAATSPQTHRRIRLPMVIPPSSQSPTP